MTDIIDDVNNYVMDNFSSIPKKPVLRLSPAGYQEFMDVLGNSSWFDMVGDDPTGERHRKARDAKGIDRINIDTGAFDVLVDEAQTERFLVQ